MDPTAAYHQFRVSSTGLSDAQESSIASSSLSSAMQMPTTQSDPTHPERSPSVFGSGSRKAPYGAGEAEEGYSLTFDSMATFEAWRAKEEEEKMIEFVRNDRHISKSVPPRFKEHTKLVIPDIFSRLRIVFLTVFRCVLGTRSLVGASTLRSIPKDIEKFPVGRWAPQHTSTRLRLCADSRKFSSRVPAAMRRSRSRHTTRRRRSAYVVSPGPLVHRNA